VVSGDRVERRAVTLGAGEGEEAMVLAGIAGGERVIVEAPEDLADGDEVEVREP
jgi:hypothetical protein